jgi:hypothetical protein
MLTFLPNKVTVSIALTAVSLSLTPITSVSGAAQAAPAANGTSKPLSKEAHSQHSAHPESLAKTRCISSWSLIKCYAQANDAYNDFTERLLARANTDRAHQSIDCCR